MKLNKARVLVTGASAGIGAATAEAFCAAGAKQVVAVARREGRLQELCAAWAHKHGADVVPVVHDVRDAAALERLRKQHAKVFDVDVLVNNAGLARGVDPMQAADPADWQEMIETNISGLLHMTRAVLPRMVERQDGHIVNLGSVAGRWSYPGGGVYGATKSAVAALTEGLRYDLMGTGVRVTNIAPGLVETEFSEVRFRGDGARAKKVYADTRTLTAADVAEAILWCVQRPEHVNVQEMILYPTDQAGVTHVHRKK
jgi:3-hydroxy acid dehydrogenase / malonic semialdehyde reductase